MNLFISEEQIFAWVDYASVLKRKCIKQMKQEIYGGWKISSNVLEQGMNLAELTHYGL